MKRKFLIIIFSFLILLTISENDKAEAETTPPLQCVAYIPIVMDVRKSGTIPVGSECVTTTVQVNFNVALTGEPIVAQRGFKVGYPGGNDEHFALGTVKIVSGPYIVGGDQIVQFDVQVCFRDVDTNQSAVWEFAYSVGAWPMGVVAPPPPCTNITWTCNGGSNCLPPSFASVCDYNTQNTVIGGPNFCCMGVQANCTAMDPYINCSCQGSCATPAASINYSCCAK